MKLKFTITRQVEEYAEVVLDITKSEMVEHGYEGSIRDEAENYVLENFNIYELVDEAGGWKSADSGNEEPTLTLD
tara:strand:+ start:309 stop:533 length:225 start_codon:yes stop_codon:yes gene_type:complete